MMRVAIYLRSATASRDGCDALARQRTFAEQYCASMGLAITQVYSDCGVSGLLPLEQRPGGAMLLVDGRSRKFDRLLVASFDRLSRDLNVILTTIRTLERCGVEVFSISEDEAPLPAMSEFLSSSGSAR